MNEAEYIKKKEELDRKFNSRFTIIHFKIRAMLSCDEGEELFRKYIMDTVKRETPESIEILEDVIIKHFREQFKAYVLDIIRKKDQLMIDALRAVIDKHFKEFTGMVDKYMVLV